MARPVFVGRWTALLSDWVWAGACVAVFWLLILWTFRVTALSMEDIWARSDTFAHGYLILPIALWLVYRQRAALARVQPAPSLLGLVLVLPPALAWLAASLVDVGVVMQFSLVGMLVAGTWAIVGTPAMRLLAFPLGFLFLAVPMGEGLILPMQELTATVTVRMVELSGVPVYRDGLSFSLPTGEWRVVEACSGVRYLIASLTLGILYAYLNYQGLWKRLLFVGVSVLVPIAANAVRAYLIVMLGHWSDGRLATGVDHLIYGWVFFGVVMLILFMIGSRWADADPAPDTEPGAGAAKGRSGAARILLVAMALALLLATGPRWAYMSLAAAGADASPAAGALAPPALAPWQPGAMDDAPWVPASVGASSVDARAYGDGHSRVYLVVQQFPPEEAGGVEAIAHFRALKGRDESWVLVDQGTRDAEWGTASLPVNTVTMVRGDQRLRIWHWYRVGPYHTGSAVTAKVYQLWLKLRGEYAGTHRLVLYGTEETGQPVTATLRDFLQVHRAALLGDG